MITRDDIRELANFHSPEASAVTFYYQPSTPLNKSHREESILVKDLVRDALRESEKSGRNGAARADLERISNIAESLHNNGRKAKAIFACSQQGFWREFELPASLPKTNLMVNQRFHLKPLAAALDGARHVCVLLADRSKARIFEMTNDEIAEKMDFVNELTRRRGKSDGWGGYDGGHAERRQTNEAMQHFKAVSEYIEHAFERGGCDQLLVGSHDDVWSEIEPQLHTISKQRLAGHFRMDPKSATAEQVKETAHRLVAEHDLREKQALIVEVIGEAHANGRGAIGLRRVLRSLEVGEVQTLLMGATFQAPGVKCYHCGHMDFHVASQCVVCGKDNTPLEDIGDAIVGHVIRNGIHIVYVADDEQFDQIGRIAALLRFRADQNTSVKAAS